MKNITVPFFISHQGCPHTCSFCDQKTISASVGTIPTESELEKKILSWHDSAFGRPVDVAFFGGTFTALPESIQNSMLQPVKRLIDAGKVRGVRVSTRPDAIDDENVCRLRYYGVKTIEIGVQSLDEEVLALSGRGHSAHDSLLAVECIKANAVFVVAQLMPGLPADSEAKSISGVKTLLDAGVNGLRIYPTIVIKGTALSDMFLRGDYKPLHLNSAVSVCKKMLHAAMKAEVHVIRMGLQADDGLNNETIVAGPWHPAFGQLVRSALYADLITCLLSFEAENQIYELHCHPSRVSDCIGHGGEHLRRFAKSISGVVGDLSLKKEEVILVNMNKSFKGSIIDDLNYTI